MGSEASDLKKSELISSNDIMFSIIAKLFPRYITKKPENNVPIAIKHQFKCFNSFGFNITEVVTIKTEKSK